MSLHECPNPGCDRKFIDSATLHEHAEAVHTFDDVRQTVADALRETFGQKGDRTNSTPYIWCWVQDIADDWVVFQYENDSISESSLQKCSYSMVDGNVTFGDPVEVVRRTIYDPKQNGTPAARTGSD